MKVALPLLLFFSLIYPAVAITIDISDLDLTKNYEIIIYNHTGAKIGVLRSGDVNSSSITLNPNDSYIFVIKPSEPSIFSDPLQAIEFLKVTIPLYLNYLLFLVAFIAGLYVVIRIIAR